MVFRYEKMRCITVSSRLSSISFLQPGHVLSGRFEWIYQARLCWANPRAQLLGEIQGTSLRCRRWGCAQVRTPGVGQREHSGFCQVLIPYSTSGNSFFSQKSYSLPALKQIFREYNSLSPHLILLIDNETSFATDLIKARVKGNH